MNQLLGDALALCREHGKPDLFVTMTCNPMWPEIQDNLRESDTNSILDLDTMFAVPGQTAQDRPDLVARVFNLKWKQLLDLLFVKQIYGRVVMRCWNLEWQKRGLLFFKV